MRAHFIILMAFAAMASQAPASAEDQAYPIKLQRPFVPHTTYEVHATADQNWSMKGAVLDREVFNKNESFAGELTGRISDAQFDAKGQFTGFSLAIAHLTNVGRDAIRPGTMLTVTYNRRLRPLNGNDFQQFTMDDVHQLEARMPKFVDASGRPAPDNAKIILNCMFGGFHDVEGTLDDAVGTTTPRKAGETWKIVPESAARFFTAELFTLQAFSVSGTSKLVGLEDAHGVPAFRVTGDVMAKDFPIQGDNKVVMLDSSKANFHMNVLVPMESAQPALEYEETADVSAHGSTVNNSGQVALALHRGRKMQITPVNAAATQPTASALLSH